MQYEKLITKKTTRSVSIAGSKVASVRINNSLTTVARAFEYDKIGVFAANGVCDEVSLLDQAQCNLKQGIPYPCRLAADLHRSEDYSAPVIAENVDEWSSSFLCTTGASRSRASLILSAVII